MFGLETLIRVGGVVQIGLVCVATAVPLILDWRTRLAPLLPFMRRLMWVYAVFTMFVVASFGMLSLMYADAMTTGTPLGRALCGIIAVFWLGRLVVQIFVFDVRPLVRSRFIMLGFHGFTAAFTYLMVVYGLAAALPPRALL